MTILNFTNSFPDGNACIVHFKVQKTHEEVIKIEDLSGILLWVHIAIGNVKRLLSDIVSSTEKRVFTIEWFD
jgi:hypothetical protein